MKSINPNFKKIADVISKGKDKFTDDKKKKKSIFNKK